MGLKIFARPSELPITLAEAREHLRLGSDTSQDGKVLALCYAAAEAAEGYTGRALCTQTWDLALDRFPECELTMPKGSLRSVSFVKYIDTAGVEQTLSSTYYQVDTKQDPGRFGQAYGFTWPCPREQLSAVTIRFVCGYGGVAAVPFTIKAGCLLHVQAHFDRDDREMAKLIEAAQSLWFPHRLWSF